MLEEMSFHHIGVAVFDIDATASMYVAAGYVQGETTYDPIQNVHICFLHKEGMPVIELLAPNDESSPVYKILERNGVTPYHCCYEVTDIDEAVARLRKMRYVATSKPVPAVAIEGRRVCFLFNKKVGLIELVETNKQD